MASTPLDRRDPQAPEQPVTAGEAPKNARRDAIAGAVVVAAFVAWCLYYIHRTSIAYEDGRVFLLWDDAMISMRYARNFVDGHGLAWNPDGERIQGYSNPGLTLLMAGLHLLPLAPERVSLAFQLVNVGFLLGIVWLVQDLARAVCGENPYVGRLAAIATMANAPLAILSLQGTDVGASTLLLVWALRSFVRGHKHAGKTPVTVFVLLGLSVLVRPDAVVPLTVLSVAGARLERGRRSLVFGALTGALTVGALLAFGLAYYGDALPNTYYLKATGSPRLAVLASGLGQTFTTVRGLGLVLVIAAAGSLAFHKRDPFVRTLAATALALFAYNAWVGGDWIWQYTSRFVAPALPILIVLFEVALWSIAQRIAMVRDDGTEPEPGKTDVLRLPPGRRVDAFVFASLVASTAFSPQTALVEWLNPSQPTMFYADNVMNYRLGRYVRRVTAEDTSVALRWAGTLAYFAERPAIDVLGKSDRHIARMVVDRFEPGHSKWDWDYVLRERRPDIVDGDDRGLGEREDFRALYRAVFKKGRGEPLFFLRASSAHKLSDPEAELRPLDPR
jgi:arabinofuranosyltransferase